MRIQTLINAVLILLIAVLCGRIVSTVRRPVPVVPVDASPAVTVPPVGGNLLVKPSQQETAAMVTTIAENNLFSPNRGVVEKSTETETKVVVAPPDHLKLVGTLVTKHRAEAFLTDASQGNKVVRIKQGESIGNYQVLQVMPIEVQLSMGTGGEVVPLRLRILDSATSQQAPRLVPQAAPQNGAAHLGTAEGRPPGMPAGDPSQAAPEEAQALRENIQRMQQRLRRIRRRAAREEAQARGENTGEDNADDEGEDDETE